MAETEEPDTEMSAPAGAPDPGPVAVARPETVARLTELIDLFHNASPETVTAETDEAGTIHLRIGAFDGDFLSLAVKVPSPEKFVAARPILLDVDAVASRPITVFLRLNVAGLGSRKNLHDALVLTEGPRQIAFDLLPLDLAELEPTDAWLDVILAEPANTEISITRLEATG